jgi:signal transduction histidine kinase
MTRLTVKSLIVEDNPGDADLAAAILSENKYVSFALTPLATMGEALTVLSSQLYDVILLDLNLPDSHGLETLSKIKSVCGGAAVVVVSGLVDEILRANLVALGAEEVISKEELQNKLFPLAILYAVERNRVREQEKQLSKILDTTPDAVVVVDREGHVKYVNNQALTFFGRSREEFIAERLIFSASEGSTVELRLPRQTGERVGDLRVIEFEWHGSPCFLASIRDITEQRNLEIQLLMSDRLASLGTLAAGVAHEINNPLAAVLANVDLAMRDVMALEGEHTNLLEGLRDTREATEQIRQIAGDIKVFARNEDERTGVDVHRILDSVARMAQNEIRHSARLVKEYNAVPLVYVNESRLSQVILNLLVNAAQAIPPGHADKNEIKITTRMHPDGRVAIEVSDTGPGIPPELQHRLFTPFFTTKPVGTGTGLGLAICQRIIKGLGGEISFESQLGKGTSFLVLLPAATAEPLLVKADTKLASAVRRGRVLIIDDDSLVVSVLQRALAREHDVTCFFDASKALELINGGERFDLILCDIMMPVMTGTEFLQALQSSNAEQANKLVFMTGNLQKLPAVQRHQHIEKPFDIIKLCALVNELVK